MGKTPTWEPLPSIREALYEAGKEYDREGLTRAGRAFKKHVKRSGIWGEPELYAWRCNERGEAFLKEIVFSQDTGWERRFHNLYGDIIEAFCPDGRGARWREADNHLFGFLDPCCWYK